MFVINVKIILFLVTVISNVCHGQTGTQPNFQGRERPFVQTTITPQSEQLRLNNIRRGQGKPLNFGQTPVFDFGQKHEVQTQHNEVGNQHVPENRNPNSFVLPPRSGFGFSQNYPNGNDFGFQHQPFAGGFYPMMGLNPYLG